MTDSMPREDHAAGPLVICGMHRSGTSLTASAFASAGVNIGERLLGADASNKLGHFEDVGFLEFHVRALDSLGFATEGYLTRPLPPLTNEFVAEARQLIAARSATGRLWGWKEPRTALFLDFWDQLLPDARYVFVFRNPWDVADSLFRRGDTAFVVDPRLAIDIWVNYNRQIVEFADRHPTRCLVFEISQVIAEPDLVFEMVRSRLRLSVSTPPDCFRSDLFGRECNPHGAAIVRALVPEAHAIYQRLRQLAGEPPHTTDDPASEATSLAAYAIEEWARASRAGIRERRLQAELSSVAIREHDLTTALATTTNDRDHIAQQLVAVTAERDRLAKELEVVAASRLRIGADYRELGARHDRLAGELARVRRGGLIRRLKRWIRGRAERPWLAQPQPRDPSDGESADRRTAA